MGTGGAGLSGCWDENGVPKDQLQVFPHTQLDEGPETPRATREASGQSEWLQSESLQAINAGEDVEKSEPSYTVGGNAN